MTGCAREGCGQESCATVHMTNDASGGHDFVSAPVTIAESQVVDRRDLDGLPDLIHEKWTELVDLVRARVEDAGFDPRSGELTISLPDHAERFERDEVTLLAEWTPRRPEPFLLGLPTIPTTTEET